MTTFWQEHQVGGPYASLEESEQALSERFHLYPQLLDLMPISYPGQSVLDYGCGPGHDTILFLLNHARHVFYADVSWQALQTTTQRLEMHGLRKRATPILLPNEDLPIVNHVHCAGVLHHVEDPIGALLAMRRALPKGEARVMVYDGDLSKHTQSDVPITEWWTKRQFLALAAEAGWQGEWMGSYPCSAEWRPDCHASCYRLV